MQEKNIVNRYHPPIIVNLMPDVLSAGLTRAMILGYAFVITESVVLRIFHLARPE
jgi:hypothetical protein